MRKRIVTIDPDLHVSNQSIDEMRKTLNDFGIQPLFVVKGIEILEPDKKRKKHRLTRKRRSKLFSTLAERRVGKYIDWLKGDLGL